MKKIGLLILSSSLFCSVLLANDIDKEIIKENQNTCSSKDLTVAVAKLIVKLENLEKRNLLLENELNQMKLNMLKKVENNNEIKPKSSFNQKENKSFNEKTEILNETTFLVTSKKAYLYTIPEYNNFDSTKESFKFGEIIHSDKQNKFGWVHIKDKGWVRGFLLSPAVENLK